MLRLRQAVIATDDKASADALRALLGAGEPYRDPEVAAFGLTNVLFPVGDQFVEIIFPETDTAPARRFIDRSGGGGYMMVFQVDDLAAARGRVDKMGVRRVFDVDLDFIAASHLHPADIGGAVVSIDEARPPESWHWAGADWQARRGEGRCTGLSGATLASTDPDAMAARWSEALGRPAKDRRIALDEGALVFEPGGADKIVAFHIAAADPQAFLQNAQAAGLETEADAILLAGARLLVDRVD